MKKKLPSRSEVAEVLRQGVETRFAENTLSTDDKEKLLDWLEYCFTEELTGECRFRKAVPMDEFKEQYLTYIMEQVHLHGDLIDVYEEYHYDADRGLIYELKNSDLKFSEAYDHITRMLKRTTEEHNDVKIIEGEYIIFVLPSWESIEEVKDTMDYQEWCKKNKVYRKDMWKNC